MSKMNCRTKFGGCEKKECTTSGVCKEWANKNIRPYREEYALSQDEGTIIFTKPKDAYEVAPPAKQKPVRLYMAGNGMVVCGDKYGQQIGELQKSFIQLWTEHAVRAMIQWILKKLNFPIAELS
jgi:hypothetical protein